MEGEKNQFSFDIIYMYFNKICNAHFYRNKIVIINI